MPSYPVLIVLFAMKCCATNTRDGLFYDPTSPPPPPSARGQEQKSTHISEFTDPATGLNPFLDLEEGRTGGMGRNIVEEDAPPRNFPENGLIEGGPSDRLPPRGSNSFDRSWGNFNRQQQYVVPALTTASPSRDRPNRNWGYDQFPTATEDGSQISSDDLPPLRENSEVEEPDYSLRPVDDQSLDSDYGTEYREVEADPVMDQDDIAPTKKVSVPKSALMTAAITGASVAVVALLLAICWWKQKMKRLSTRGTMGVTDGNIESVIGDKAGINSDFQKKSVCA